MPSAHKSPRVAEGTVDGLEEDDLGNVLDVQQVLVLQVAVHTNILLVEPRSAINAMTTEEQHVSSIELDYLLFAFNPRT